MASTSNRTLTARQTAFVELVLGGATHVAAYRQAYAGQKSNAATVSKNAYRTFHNPRIQAEIQALTLERFPPASDYRAMWGHSIAIFADLSIRARSENVRLNAAIWLAELAQVGSALSRGPAAATTGGVLLKLRALFQRAQAVEEKADGAPVDR